MTLPKNGVAKEIRHYSGALLIFLFIASSILISFSLTLLVVVVGVILTYNGYFKDSDKDGIPDKVEDKVKEVKKRVYKKKK